MCKNILSVAKASRLSKCLTLLPQQKAQSVELQHERWSERRLNVACLYELPIVMGLSPQRVKTSFQRYQITSHSLIVAFC